MDNITHSLAGLAVGELLHRTLQSEDGAAAQSTRRRMLLVSCWAANNFPDLDLLLRSRLPAPLDYLLDHRGHTHTLLYALPQALLIAALVWLLWPAARRLLGASGTARRGLALAVGLGLGMHIGMDFLNSYGVHPFYPLDSRWFYGDTLFIVEPVLWMAFGAPLAMMLPRRWMRIGAALAFVLVLGALVSRDFLSWGSVLGLFAGAAALACLQGRAGLAGRSAIIGGLLLAIGFAGAQSFISAHGKRLVQAHLLHLDPATRVLDIAMAPLPANPLCWTFVSLEQARGAATYRLRRGMYSPAPALTGLADCPAALSTATLAGTRQVGLGWQEEFALSRLQALAATCRGNAWLRFARMPVLRPETATDARFSSGAANFSTMALGQPDLSPCPAGIPQWAMPRADLVQGQ